MTCSAARIAANQANAAKSTGPKTEAGKARSRLNARKHGLAGGGDVLGPDDDHGLIEHRAATMRLELGAPGALGQILAHRAAVLSVRMEQAADRNRAASLAATAAARAEFDDERATQIDGWLAELDGPELRPEALAHLEADPEGLGYLIESWQELRAAVGAQTAGAAERAARRLDRTAAAGISPPDLLGAIDAELTRLGEAATSAATRRAAHRIAAQRHEVGVLASFDPGPEAALARRYEAAAERGMYQAMRQIAQLRLGQAQAVGDEVTHRPPIQPAPPPASPFAATAASARLAAALGSFRLPPGEPTAGVIPVTASRVEPDHPATSTARRRPDLAKIAANRR